MEKLNRDVCAPVLFMSLLGINACFLEESPKAHLSIDNETNQRIEVEITNETEAGQYTTAYKLSPDEDPDKAPRAESGDGEDGILSRWHRSTGGPKEINRYIKKITIRTERGCVFGLTPDKVEEWSYGPDYQFWVDLTPERMACPDESNSE